MKAHFTLADIDGIAQQLWHEQKHKKVWAFHGEMGVGKTTFISVLCSVLGVADTVASPTYSLINEYRSNIAGTIYHLDLYRLRDEEEAMQAGVEDVLYSGQHCLVEWPEKAPGIIPPDCLHIYLELVNEMTRSIQW